MNRLAVAALSKIILVSVVSGLSLSGCRSAASRVADADTVAPTQEAFDIIDSSFLLPFPKKDGFNIKAAGDEVDTATGPLASTLMSLEQFRRLPEVFFRHTGKNESAEQLLDKLYITGFRYDPCFPIVTPDLSPNSPACRLRAIRLVGQFIDFEKSEASAATMHILFVTKSPDPAQDFGINNAIVQSLKGLRASAGVDTRGVPLGIHPGFSGENRTEFSRQAKELILRFAGQKNFFATSIYFREPSTNLSDLEVHSWAQFLMKPLDPQDPASARGLFLEPVTGTKPDEATDFSHFMVDRTGRARTIPGAADLRDTQDPTNPLFFPIPDLTPLYDLGTGATPSVDSVNAGIAAADLYENASKMTIPAGDCAGCHVATQRRLSAKAFSPNSITRSPFAFPEATDVTHQLERSILDRMTMVPDGEKEKNIVINFGYHGSQLVISQRTINEAVQVTKLINHSMLDGQWMPQPAPTPVPAN